jgi:hypothetical protein
MTTLFSPFMPICLNLCIHSGWASLLALSEEDNRLLVMPWVGAGEFVLKSLLLQLLSWMFHQSPRWRFWLKYYSFLQLPQVLQSCLSSLAFIDPQLDSIRLKGQDTPFCQVMWPPELFHHGLRPGLG